MDKVTQTRTAAEVIALARRYRPAPATPVVRFTWQKPAQRQQQPKSNPIENYTPANHPYDKEHAMQWMGIHHQFRMTEAFEQLVSDVPKMPPRLTMSQIAEVVCEHFRITVTDLRSHRRTTSVVYPRHIFCFVVKSTSVRSLPMIGRWLDRDHTTILHAVRKITNLKDCNFDVARDIEEIQRNLFWKSNSG